MKAVHFTSLILAIIFVDLGVSQKGAKWSNEEADIIAEKIRTLIFKTDKVVDEYFFLYPNRPKKYYVSSTKPNAPKV